MKPPTFQLAALSRKDEFSLPALDLIGLLRAVLEKGKSLRFHANAEGSSMVPFLKDGDVITVSPPRSRGFVVGDVAAVHHSGANRIVIHRVIGVGHAHLLFKGDNLRSPDGLIPKSNVLGRVTKVERDGRTLRFGVGPESPVIAFFSRAGLLIPAVRVAVGSSGCSFPGGP